MTYRVKGIDVIAIPGGDLLRLTLQGFIGDNVEQTLCFALTAQQAQQLAETLQAFGQLAETSDARA